MSNEILVRFIFGKKIIDKSKIAKKHSQQKVGKELINAIKQKQKHRLVFSKKSQPSKFKTKNRCHLGSLNYDLLIYD